MPVGQTVSIDWGTKTRWLENSLADRLEEVLIMAWHSDNVHWSALRSEVIQYQVLHWKWHTESLHSTIALLPHDPVVPWWSWRPSFPLPYLQKSYLLKRKNLLCFVFSFLILWKSGLPSLFLFVSMENLWHTGSTSPTDDHGSRGKSSTDRNSTIKDFY